MATWAAWPRNASKCNQNRSFWQLGQPGPEMVRTIMLAIHFRCLGGLRWPRPAMLQRFNIPPQTINSFLELIHHIINTSLKLKTLAPAMIATYAHLIRNGWFTLRRFQSIGPCLFCSQFEALSQLPVTANVKTISPNSQKESD